MRLLLVCKTQDDRGSECYYPHGEYASMKEAKAALEALEHKYSKYIYVILEIRAEFTIEEFKGTRVIEI